MDVIDTFKYLVGGYYGVMSMDEYDLKVYILKDIEEYIKTFIENNKVDNFDYKKAALEINDTVSLNKKLCIILWQITIIYCFSPFNSTFIIFFFTSKYIK
jgi:hypothetical protein